MLKILLQYNFVLQRIRLEGWELYCNTGICVAVRHLGWAGSVLQYTGLYFREEG